jgi:hypothetical protein
MFTSVSLVRQIIIIIFNLLQFLSGVGEEYFRSQAKGAGGKWLTGGNVSEESLDIAASKYYATIRDVAEFFKTRNFRHIRLY